MKKIWLCMVGVLTVLSLAACSPSFTEEDLGSPAPAPEQQTEREVVEKVGDPDAPVLDMAFIYSGNDDATGLNRELVDLEELNEQALVDQLIDVQILEAGTLANSFDIEGGEKAGPGVDSSEAGSGERIGILDLSAVPSSGTAGETIILASIGNTFIENFELDKLKLLVNGENYSSGHIEHGDEDYLEYIEDYENFMK